MTSKIATALFLLFFLAIVVLVNMQARADGSGKRDCTIYIYIDDHGRSVKTTRLSAVPKSKRSAMVSTQDCELARRKGGYSYIREEARDGSETGEARKSDSRSIERSSVNSLFHALRIKMRRRWLWVCLSVTTLVAAWIGILVAAWRVGLIWFLLTLLGALYFPPIVLVFVIFHWRVAKVPFIAYWVAWITFVLLLLL